MPPRRRVVLPDCWIRGKEPLLRLVRFSLPSALRAAVKPAFLLALTGAGLLNVGCNSNGPFDMNKGWIDPSELAGRSSDRHRTQRILETLPLAVVDKVDPLM